jgi:hypothetical protein
MIFPVPRCFFFRSKGAFGIPYLGKVYFVSCILFSWMISSYFNLFANNESRFWSVLLYGVRFIGLILLSQSASNRELSMFFIFLGCMLPLLMESLYYWQYSMLIIETYKQRNRYSSVWSRIPIIGYFFTTRSGPRKISNEELEKRIHDNTEKELLKLRQFLQQNPSQLTKTKEKFYENNKNHEIHLLNSFVKGDYKGLPYTGKKDLNKDDEEDEDGFETGNSESIGFTKYFIYASIIVVLVSLVKVYKNDLLMYLRMILEWKN